MTPPPSTPDEPDDEPPRLGFRSTRGQPRAALGIVSLALGVLALVGAWVPRFTAFQPGGACAAIEVAVESGYVLLITDADDTSSRER